jgi:guanylate kinase
MRQGELNGVDYHFIETEAFREMIEQQQLAEWAEVHGNMYGTSVETLKKAAGDGLDLLLDIDCQGAAQIKKNYAQGVFIFILPPDLVELERRLRERRTENEADIKRRLKNAQDEVKQATWYDYLVVNDDFSSAKETLSAIVTAERSRVKRNKNLLCGYSTKGDI